MKRKNIMIGIICLCIIAGIVTAAWLLTSDPFSGGPDTGVSDPTATEAPDKSEPSGSASSGNESSGLVYDSSGNSVSDGQAYFRFDMGDYSTIEGIQSDLERLDQEFQSYMENCKSDDLKNNAQKLYDSTKEYLNGALDCLKNPQKIE